jgi:hypothetical protein
MNIMMKWLNCRSTDHRVCSSALNPFSSFWVVCAKEYPELSAKAMNVFLLFPTTYLCKSAFFALIATETKYRSRLHVESDLIDGVLITHTATH